MRDIFFLLALFQIKHWLCDYPFQTPYMLGKFKGGWEWVRPLRNHALVHAMGTLAVLAIFHSAKGIQLAGLWVMFLPALDFSLHFVVDRIKAAPNLGGRWKMDSRYFWWALGADQAAHHLTHYLIIWLLVFGQR